MVNGLHHNLASRQMRKVATVTDRQSGRHSSHGVAAGGNSRLLRAAKCKMLSLGEYGFLLFQVVEKKNRPTMEYLVLNPTSVNLSFPEM